MAFAAGFTLASACGSAPQPAAAPRAADPVAASTPAASTPAATAADVRAAVPLFPLQVRGTGFVDGGGGPWPWRGITSFRLAEMLAAGREAAVIQYLDWAVAQDVTVVRVLLMAEHLFTLTPEAGRAALPRLLDLARERGLAVEAVALADTRGRNMDLEAHVREVGRIALDKGNAFVELANEPGHPTQDPRLHDPATLQRMFERLPDPLIVALGSAEYAPAYAAADYATYHFPREPEWGHVLALAEGAGMLARWRKPVINDEPIGADVAYRAGRRDNEPARFAAAAALSRLIGLGATFHYEGGLRSALPNATEQAAFDAWRAGERLVAPMPADGRFLSGGEVDQLCAVSGGRAAFGRQSGDRALLLVVGGSGAVSLRCDVSWVETARASVGGATAVQIARNPR